MQEVLAALSGQGPAPHERVLTPPPQLDGRAHPGPPDAKGVYGTPYADHVNSTNFTVNWAAGVTDSATADTVSQAMEEAWTALVRQQGWTPPVSSDQFLVWVILDTGISGTGLTTEYFTDDYPDGYPVIYINPAYASFPEFFRSLCAHEFAHSLQFALRDYYRGTEESWYWEASAEWQAELALPDEDAYGAQSQYYSDAPDERYSSTTNYHQYGMFLLNAYIEEHITGDDGLHEIWDYASTHGDSDWDVVLSGALETDVEAIWAGFNVTMATGDLREWHLYRRPTREGDLEDGLTGSLPYLGTHYYDVREAATVQAEGDVLLAGPDGFGPEVAVQRGDTLAVLGVNQTETSYTLLYVVPEDTDDGGPNTTPLPDDDSKTCAATPRASGLSAALLALALLRRRRAP